MSSATGEPGTCRPTPSSSGGCDERSSWQASASLGSRHRCRGGQPPSGAWTDCGSPSGSSSRGTGGGGTNAEMPCWTIVAAIATPRTTSTGSTGSSGRSSVTGRRQSLCACARRSAPPPRDPLRSPEYIPPGIRGLCTRDERGVGRGAGVRRIPAAPAGATAGEDGGGREGGGEDAEPDQTVAVVARSRSGGRGRVDGARQPGRQRVRPDLGEGGQVTGVAVGHGGQAVERAACRERGRRRPGGGRGGRAGRLGRRLAGPGGGRGRCAVRGRGRRRRPVPPGRGRRPATRTTSTIRTAGVR